MRCVLVTIFAALLLPVAFPGGASAADRTILVVGDSLSAGLGVDLAEGWVALLQDRLESEGYGYRVVNASISGDTTGGGLRRLPRALELHGPDIVLIELGGNDGLRGTPVEIIRTNLAEMIRLARGAGAGVILAGMQLPPNYGGPYTEAFSGLYRELAESLDVALVPFFMDGVALDPALMQPDGIHPNSDGQPRLMENVWTVLEPALEARRAGDAPADRIGAVPRQAFRETSRIAATAASP